MCEPVSVTEYNSGGVGGGCSKIFANLKCKKISKTFNKDNEKKVFYFSGIICRLSEYLPYTDQIHQISKTLVFMLPD